MSIRAMMAVWENSCAKGGSLVIMLALADMANDDMECWPGKASLSTKCRMSRRALDLAIHRLIASGEIQVMHRRVDKERNKTNVYRLTLPDRGFIHSPIPDSSTCPIPDSSTPRSLIHPLDESTIIQWMNQGSSDPSLDPSLDPLSDPRASTKPTNSILEILKARRS